MSSLIELINVSKTYKMGEQSCIALADIHFSMARGEMTAIVGASGSGKSTLMNITGFLDCCTTGQYLFDGQDVSHLSEPDLALIRNRKIGFVFQSFFLLPRVTALQNVMLPLFYRGLSRAESIEKAMYMLEKMCVAHFAHHRPDQLSGGQQQRVAMARALVGEPDIILADEPTGALDSQTSETVMALLENLHEQENRTILLITHDKAVSRRCQRVVTIKDGRIAL